MYTVDAERRASGAAGSGSEARADAVRRRLHAFLRHEVARLIVWQVVLTRPVVPSAVSYGVRQQGNALSKAPGQGTHSHPTGTKTVRPRCLCQHQAEMGLDGWYGEHM